MHKKPKSPGILRLLGIASMTFLPAAAMSDGSHSHGGATYEVTITNLTPGQPLTPPVLVTHSRGTRLFTLGEPSSPEIQAVAENGNPGPLLAALADDDYVHDVVQGAAPVLPANDPAGTGLASSVSFTIEAGRDARYLSFISMLICTNDGFTGLDSVRLPAFSKTLYSVAYDARSEMNTEYLGDMVPPCQALIGVTGDPGTGESNPLLAEGGVVIPHVGINGGVDLFPQVHGWTDPVARIVITRVSH